MLIGCLFTIAGYILASLGGQTTHAQQSGQVIDEIVCRKLKVIHLTGKEVVSIFPIENGGGIIVNNTKGKRVAVIGVVKDGSGSIAVAGNTGKSGANITGDKYGVVWASIAKTEGKLSPSVYLKKATGRYKPTKAVGEPTKLTMMNNTSIVLRGRKLPH